MIHKPRSLVDRMVLPDDPFPSRRRALGRSVARIDRPDFLMNPYRFAAPGGGPPIAFVQKSAVQTAGSTTGITLSLNGVQAGNFLVVCVAAFCGGSTPAPPLPTPPGWMAAEAPVGPADAAAPAVAIFYKENASAGTNTAVISGYSAGSWFVASIAEFSGVLTASSLDVHTNNVTATYGLAGNTGNTAVNTVANSLVVAAISPIDAADSTQNLSDPPSAGYITLGCYPNTGITPGDFGYKILTSTGTQTASWTWSNNSCYAAVIAVFKGH